MSGMDAEQVQITDNLVGVVVKEVPRQMRTVFLFRTGVFSFNSLFKNAHVRCS